MSIRTFKGKEQEDVILWVQYFQQIASLSGWSNNEAIALAELHMLDKAQSWFVGLDRATLTSFDALAKLMIDRFGDSKTTLMTRLDHRKQEVTESVRDYVDAMRLLFAKTRYPAEGQATKFTSVSMDTDKRLSLIRLLLIISFVSHRDNEESVHLNV